jgi:hypothetical protein
MNTTETAPPSASSPKEQAPSGSGAVPTTFEECLKMIDEVTTSATASLDDAKSALRRLKGFFDKRIGKKQASAEQDGTNALKRTFEQNQKYKKYEPQPLKAETTTTASPWK